MKYQINCECKNNFMTVVVTNKVSFLEIFSF